MFTGCSLILIIGKNNMVDHDTSHGNGNEVEVDSTEILNNK